MPVRQSDIALLITTIGLHRYGVKGRTRIQKEMCILKHRDNVSMSFDFKSYYYGPYSSELSDIIDSLVAIDLLEQSTVELGLGVYRYDYELTEQGVRLFSTIKEELKKNAPELLIELEGNVRKLEEMPIPDIVSLAKECSGIRSMTTGS